MAVKTLYSQFDDKKAAPYVFCDSLKKLVIVLNVELTIFSSKASNVLMETIH
jgi:hypothetical protein